MAAAGDAAPMSAAVAVTEKHSLNGTHRVFFHEVHFRFAKFPVLVAHHPTMWSRTTIYGQIKSSRSCCKGYERRNTAVRSIGDNRCFASLRRRIRHLDTRGGARLLRCSLVAGWAYLILVAITVLFAMSVVFPKTMTGVVRVRDLGQLSFVICGRVAHNFVYESGRPAYSK